MAPACTFSRKPARRRFDVFPKLIADDLYVRVQFKPEERETLAVARSIVFAPHTVNKLIAIETRADLGSFELSRLYPELWKNRGDSNNRTLVTLFKNPLLWPRLFTYWYVKTMARRKAKIRLRTNTLVWERDETSRGERKTRSFLLGR